MDRNGSEEHNEEKAEGDEEDVETTGRPGGEKDVAQHNASNGEAVG